MKYMTVKEFREKGFLQEVNRQFLHPLGLALQVAIDEQGKEIINAILDCQDDAEGIVFSELRESSIQKADYIQRLQQTKAQIRHKYLGFVIQPLEG